MLVDQLNESLGLIESLKVNIQQKHAEYDGQCGAIRQLATAKQTVLFLLWVNSNAEKLSRVGFCMFVDFVLPRYVVLHSVWF